jgi:uncharacterized protein (DUF427 family)
MYWGKADAWFEEDERVFGHLRDPYHRVDIRASSRRARVLAAGEVVAESANPVLVFETNLPVRAYFRREELRVELIPSEKQTICPYKGLASYWSLRVEGETIPDAVWSYEDPLDGARGIRDLVSFLAPGIEVELEGAGAIAGAAVR